MRYELTGGDSSGSTFTYCGICGQWMEKDTVHNCPGSMEVNVPSVWLSWPTRTAWQCPQCHTVYAPHVDSCDCQKGMDWDKHRSISGG